MNDTALWYATRGAGVVSLLLFTGVMCLGVLTAVRWQSRSWPRFLTAGLHRNLALISVAFLAVHIITAIVDPYVSLGWLTAIVPFSSTYRQLWLGMGVLGFDLLLAIAATSLVRGRIGYRAWRAVHWLSYASWPLALAHGIGTGTDASATWMRVLDVACVGAVLAAVAWRLLAVRPTKSAPQITIREMR
jgi:sulfoxide reductase heme-binding subunit YedZ